MMARTIFVSCTTQDLGSYRRALMGDAPLARWTRWVQEGFGAMPDQATPASLALVARAEVYVGLYGFRYGTLVPGEQRSITEAEFDEARARGLRYLIYFADDSLRDELQATCVPEPPEAAEALAAFKRKVSHYVRGTFASSGDLARHLLNDLNNLTLPLGVSRRDVAGHWARSLEDWQARHGPDLEADVESSLARQWGAFLGAGSWQDRCREELRQLTRLVEQVDPDGAFSRAVEALDWSRPCDTVRDQLERQVLSVAKRCLARLTDRSWEVENREETADHFRQHLKKLRDAVLSPGYGNAFLLAGIAGAGRSHFVAKALDGARLDLEQAPERERNALLLPIGLGDGEAGGLEAILLEKLSAASGGVRWQDFAEFDRFLGPSGLCVIVIEDLHKWQSISPGFIRGLTELMRRLDNLQHVRWLVTVNLEIFHVVTGERAHWTRYGFSERLQSIPVISGWQSLDDANITDRVGRRMVENAGRDGAMAGAELDVTGAGRHLACPLIARIFIDSGIEAPGNLVFADFAENLWHDRVERVRMIAAGDSSDSVRRLADGQTVERVVAVLADSWLETGKYLPSRLNIGRIFERRVTEDDGLAFLEPPLFQSAMDLFRRGGLLREHSLSARDAVTCEFHPELIWQFHLADALRAAPNLRKAVDGWMKGEAPPEVKEGAVEFLLLLLARGGRPDDGDLFRHFMDESFAGRLPMAVLLHAAGKAEPDIQEEVFAGLRDEVVRHDRQSLFALMLFLRGLDDAIADAPARLRLLQPEFAAIAEHGFTPFFVYLIGRFLDGAPDWQTLKDCLGALEGCEVLDGGDDEPRDVTEELAKMIVDKMVMIDGVKSAVPEVMDWLSRGEGRGRIETRRRKHRRWHRYFLHEWVLGHLCWRVVSMTSRKGLDSYHFLAGMNWYDEDDGTIHRTFRFNMEREAGIAIGHRYRNLNERERRPFVSMVETLVGEGNHREVRHAFYIIRHTSLEAGRTEVKVDEVFRPALRAVLARGEESPRGMLGRLVESQRAMFKLNLPEL